MVPLGFEPEIAASERLQTYDLDRATIGITKLVILLVLLLKLSRF